MNNLAKKLTPEEEAKLCLSLTTMLKATEAKAATMKASLALMKKKPVEEIIAHLDEACSHLYFGIEEVTVFRNILRDDRPKHVRTRVAHEKRWNGHLRNTPRTERDPVELLAEMVRGIELRREQE
jgi:hypothetical protein